MSPQLRRNVKFSQQSLIRAGYLQFLEELGAVPRVSFVEIATISDFEAVSD